MNKPDLMAELAEVVAALETKRMLTEANEGPAADHFLRTFQLKAAAFLRTHHAELEAVVRDAARYRWLRNEAHGAPNSILGIYQNWGGHDVFGPIGGADADDEIDIAIAMHNSAREG